MKIQFEKLLEVSSLSKILSNDLLLKLISLVLAIVLWVMVGGEDVIEKSIQVPVEVINLPQDLVISNQYKKELEVSLRGPRSVINELKDQSIVRLIDLSKEEPGTIVFSNDNDHIIVPRSLTVQRVQPSSIILSLDKISKKQVPIVANTVGQVADGYELKSIRMSPDFIVISGPETILKNVDELQSDYISLNSMTATQQLQVPLNLSQAVVGLIGETTVTADITVVAKETVQVVNLPVKLSNNNFTTFPETVTVTASFPETIFKSGVLPEDLLLARVENATLTERAKVIVSVRNEGNNIEIVSVSPLDVKIIDVNDNRLEKKTKEIVNKDEIKIEQIKHEPTLSDVILLKNKRQMKVKR